MGKEQDLPLVERLEAHLCMSGSYVRAQDYDEAIAKIATLTAQVGSVAKQREENAIPPWIGKLNAPVPQG